MEDTIVTEETPQVDGKTLAVVVAALVAVPLIVVGARKAYKNGRELIAIRKALKNNEETIQEIPTQL